MATLALATLATASFAAGISQIDENANEAPRAAVARTLAKVVAVLSDAELDTAQRLERIEKIAYSHFDFETMSKLVLARNWRRLSDEQKATFIVEFKLLLSRSYGSRLDRWGDEKIEIVGDRLESRGDVTVQSQIVGGGFDGATIDYRLRKSASGEWRAIDVIAEGVSLVSSYRSQFRDVLATGGPDALLREMKKKNAEALVGARREP